VTSPGSPPPAALRHAGQMDENPGLPDDQVDPVVDVAPASSIVVGHDGSGAASAALRVALQLASELGTPVTVIRAWMMATAPRPANWVFGYAPSTDEFADAVRTELISDTESDLAPFPDVTVSHRVYHANPARSLIIASQGARMLVVGSRGLGGFRELMLGSVSDECVRNAHCPVLVTREPSS
jgi:nucleotide-binding universal stress UspA family protein